MARGSGGRFSRLPTWWVRQGMLREFKGGSDAGRSISALKCLIAISHHIDFHSLTTKLSFNDFERLTGLSRPMVAKGVRLITELGIVNVEGGYRNKYTLKESMGYDDRWGKLPVSNLKKELPSIPNRGKIPLHALKIYIQLITDRKNDLSFTSMKYKTIEEKVGTQSRDIKPSIDLLFNHHLISVYRDNEGKMGRRGGYMRNCYVIKGI